MSALRTHWLTPDTGHDLVVVGPSLGTAVVPLWQTCAQLLAERAEVDVLGWDLPGHGDGPPAAGPFTLEDLAAQVVAAVAAVAAARPGEPWTHAGVSVGGAVGLHLARLGAVRASAVICSGPRLGTPPGWAERAGTVRRDGTGVMVDGSRERWFAPGFVEREPEVAERLLHSLREADAQSYALVCDALAAHDVRGALADIAVPVLALGGAHDQVAPPSMQEEMADALPDATVVILDEAAHLAPAEAPRASAETIASWLDRLPR